MKHFYTLYSGGKDLYELNKSLWEPDHQIQPGYFNLPHVLIVGANPRLVTEDMKDPFKFMFDLSDYDEFENTYRDCISTTPFGATSKTLNILCDLRSEYVSFTNVVKAPTTSENDITQEMKDKYINITKKQIELFKPLIVITLGTFAKNALIGEDAEFNHLYEINNIYYYPLYHYSYLLRHGTKKLTDYYTQSRAEINEILKTHAIIQITNRTIFYRDIDGVKQSYPNPIQFVPAYIQSPTGKYTSIYDEPLDVAPAGSIAPYEHGLQPADAFGIGRQIDFVHFYKTLIYDIETDFCNTPLNPEKRVLSVATYNAVLNKYNILTLDNGLNTIPQTYKEFKVIVCKDEVELLTRTFELFSYFDVVAGWFSNSFDILYLVNRAKRLGINIPQILPMYEIASTPSMEEYPPKCRGTYFIDLAEIFKFTANSYVVENSAAVSRSLSNVGQLLLGESKVDLPPSQIPIMWKDNILKFFEYASQDVRLTWGIAREGHLFDVLLTRQTIAKLNLDKLMYNSQVIENMLRRSYPHYKFPSRVKTQTQQSIPGGLVLPTVSGKYSNVVVFDFSSMYTSLIITFNISTDVLSSLNKAPNVNESIKIDDVAFSTHRVGMAVEIERRLKALRQHYKSLAATTTGAIHKYYYTLQDSIKQIMNSVYGVLSYPGFILYNPKVGNVITSLGQKMLSYVKTLAEEDNLNVLYGDTDSIFVKFPDSLTLEELRAQSVVYKNKFNSALRKFAEMYNHDSQYLDKYYALSIEVDKIFTKFYITSAKKRYFGYLDTPNGPQLYVKGFETRRHDTPSVFAQAYNTIYKYILDDNVPELITFLTQLKKTLPTLPVESFVMYIKVGKSVNEYDKDYELVRAAKSANIEFQRGDVVNLVYTREGEVHYQGQAVEIDYDKYFNKFIINKLQLLDTKLADIVASSLSGQSKLTDQYLQSVESP